MTNAPWPLGVDGIAYGGDYNPEQWPLATRVEDVELMQQAGVTLVSVGIFSWAQLEPREGVFDFGWLDDVLDRLAAAGIKVALATATASPPPWLTRKHPELLPELADGTVLHPGGRQAYRVSAPLWREYAVAMTRRMAERYGSHPALALWHVDNELGCHVPHDFSDDAAAAFRRWLEARYGTVEALNAAWGTAFWSQRYDAFDEVLPPRTAPTFPNPTQQLDFARYSSDELLVHYRALRDVLREVTPHVPTTTNLMLSTATKWMDYFSWSADLDVVANDHYTIASRPDAHVELALSADLSRGVAGGGPWILMEHSTSAVNWQPRNRTKRPGEMLRHSLAHVAHGADAVMFFQWRQSAAGAEKYHSAMLPHAGTDTDVWRATVELGDALRAIGEVRGSRVESEVALVWDYPAWWGVELDSHPSVDVTYQDRMLAHYRALWERHVPVDVVPPSADLSRYRLVVVPTLYLVSDEDAANVAGAARAGATVLVTYFSGIVDEDDRVRLGGYPGAFRDLLGVRTEEFWALQEGETVTLDDGSVADVWSEKVHVAPGTEVVRTFADGDLAGLPAVTRRAVGDGAAWYLATRLDGAALGALTERLLVEAGVSPVLDGVPAGVEVARRRAADGRSWLFVLNHTEAPVDLPPGDVLAGRVADGRVLGGGYAVLREASDRT
ncbi:beta-galactosidase [Cellulomonas fimi]|uniref:Beta-galactosidase n=1 Tax=Cellulomonas fimi (strain ATCC 484 / DSM 20113 / JCM 1341 / CCUG 24087 / LMG 16345 / NBRC 15513 / NCIMB 8980 / NCTC 7547 / NRS-133) TaxID=590998 RepID=F4H158_CELFA|nr:beta-galactosidase [Cellulomonas fimi]AEE47427.1 Beta-galactosidase [Cellulomonas fimi ATCC 484]NNH05596.1 beta-galactosidase [Cellulomonas fimi]VEH36187.1 Beta-galactosidase [Cellulomonas fimi]